MEGAEPQRSHKRAKEAISDALRARGEVDELGNVTLERFYQAIEAGNKARKAKHLRRMVDGGRNLQRWALEAMAERLEVGPEYFREFRIHQIEEWMDTWPEVVDAVYDMAKGKVSQLEAKEARRGKQ